MNIFIWMGIFLLLFGVYFSKWTAFALIISIVGCTVIFGGFILKERQKIMKKAIKTMAPSLIDK
ncbi:hypothetical protein [Ureibacillus thermosphaericus]|uniref:hypothetical protein n=1 Tax=Ureibacillus thermosphaericus TaxID=51173 RepID=UPI000BBC8E02|nr:hypothetical protein [Ureibacillus thermosphaericus]